MDERKLKGLTGCLAAARKIPCSTIEAKALILYYASNVNSNACSFFKSITDITIETGLSERFIYKMNEKWSGFGVLTWVSGNSVTHMANVYTLHLDKMWQAVDTQRKAFDRRKLDKTAKATERQRRWRANKKAAAEAAKAAETIPQEVPELVAV